MVRWLVDKVAKEGWRWATGGLGLPAGTPESLLDGLRPEAVRRRQ